VRWQQRFSPVLKHAAHRTGSKPNKRQGGPT
jgi:hypothetical protein